MEFFSDIYCGNLVWLLERNLPIWWGPPMTGSPGVFNPQTRAHWASCNSPSTAQLSCQALVPRWSPRVSPAQVSHNSLYSPASPVSSYLLPYGSKKDCWFFQSVQLFTCCSDVLATSKLLTCITGNQKSLRFILNAGSRSASSYNKKRSAQCRVCP